MSSKLQQYQPIRTQSCLLTDQSQLTCLLVLSAGVVLVLHLDDALPQVLQPKPLWRRPIDVDHLVSQRLARLGLREALQQLPDHVKLAPEEGVLVVGAGQRILNTGVNIFKKKNIQVYCF